MINLIPFYMNLTAPIHSELRDVLDNEQNRKLSISLLTSIMPALLDYVTDRLDVATVICCPSTKEANVIVRHLYNHVSTLKGIEATKSIHYSDLRPGRLVDFPGVHVISYPNLVKHLVSCDRLLNYYPLDLNSMRDLYRRTRTLALFDPVNKQGNYYARYVAQLADSKRGVRR